EGRGGVDFLSAPKVTTVSGREARLQVADVRTIVTGVNARVDKATEAVGFDGVLVSPTNSPAIEYQVEQMYFGPELEILPIAEGEVWQLGLTARMTEFLGYEDPGSDQPAIRVPGAKPMTAQRPLPLVRRRELTANTRIRSGEVVALRGPMVENLTVRKGGVFRRGSTNVLQKRLYVFVVPQTDPPEQAGALTPARTAQPVIVRALTETGRFLVGSREVQEFELSGVLRSLALTRPDLVLLIRKDYGSPESNLQLVQEVAAKAGIRNVTLP
ncbi:MAG: Bacterial type and secretion system protein, partial [Verrucomicrobiota bacterium]